MDAGSLGTLIGGLGSFAGAATALPYAVSRSLRKCKEENAELEDKLSAVLTELVVMRKLVPAGEWALILQRNGLAPRAFPISTGPTQPVDNI